MHPIQPTALLIMLTTHLRLDSSSMGIKHYTGTRWEDSHRGAQTSSKPGSGSTAEDRKSAESH